ncbi:hypothetical protein [Devosia ginsengisoli]|uniref:Uncharacterized protein n=1 Tax=Devosia ginsengisoli TaxID=400770 RepID=A0A5B8LQX9_9HYPH|nr:hypothetical protein [Devosia ginsengisoli]QDZ10299.1 hypothetical protein FPZ08_05775 [Devosia ginsengisoli]
MKLTWFGGTTVRIHIGGAILVVDAEGAPDGIDAAELVSGADVVIAGFGAELAEVDAARWKPRRSPRLLDVGESLPVVEAWAAGRGAVLVEAIGEAPLLLVAGEVPALGRWADGAVVVLFGDGAGLVRRGGALLDEAPPRLLALAGNEAAIDMAIPALRDRLDGTGLVALEAGMALEV